MQNLANKIISGTDIAELNLGPTSHTTFSFLPGHATVALPQLVNLADITVAADTIKQGAKVYTPGANTEQQAGVFSSFANGNEKALDSGKMGLNDASHGLFAATAGLFNANAGIQSNVRLILLWDINRQFNLNTFCM